MTPDGSGDAKVGFMNAGHGVYVGQSQYGVGMSMDDNSLWEVDDWGITTVSEKETTESMDLDVIYPAIHTTKIRIAVRDVVGTIALFIGDERDNSEYDHLMLLGRIDSFNSIINNSVITRASFSIKELM